MRRLRVLAHRFRSLFRKGAVEAELERELGLHIEALTREHVANGMNEADALRAALRDFGPSDLAKEQCRDHRRTRLVGDLVADTTFALRLLARSPGFAATAVLSLALGIGANTAIFSLVDTVLLRGLPVERPHELVFLQAVGAQGRGGAPPYPCFERLRTETTEAFVTMAAFAADELRIDVDGRVEQVFGQVASGNYFELLGLDPVVGRLLTADDERLDPPVAVIGYGYWQSRFGGRPEVVGRTLESGGRVYAIVGVTPPPFRGLHPGREVEVTLPLQRDHPRLASRSTWWFEAVARLRPGARREQAAAQADAVFQSFVGDLDGTGDTAAGRFDRLELAPAGRGLDRLRARFSKPLVALVVVAGIVLLVACANLGSLLLARGAAREKEFAIRLATGAGAGRLLRQLLTETLLLFLLGAAAALPVAHLSIQALTGFFAIGRNPIRLDVHYDWRLAAFAAAGALAAGLLTGLWPALRALRTDPQAAMKNGGRVAGSRGVVTAGRILVTGQVAMSLALVVTAVLFTRTMASLRSVDLGLDHQNVLTLSLDPVFSGGSAPEAREQFWRRTLERVRALPGVRAASLSVLTPLSGRDTGVRISVPGDDAASEAGRFVHLNHVSEGYFETFGMKLVAGRALTPADAQPPMRGAILNETAARAYFGGREAIGQRLELAEAGGYQVVGVVEDAKHLSLREPPPRFAFVPLWQPMDRITRITLAVSSDEPPSSLGAAVRREVEAIHPTTLVSDVITIGEQIDATLVSERLLSTLATAFAALALCLSAIGLFGTLSYAVARRGPELGIRIAVGAGPARVAWTVVRDMLWPVGCGLAVGLPVAAAAANAARTLLFGVAPGDPRLYLLSATLVTSVASLAAWLPARRASVIDPLSALRGE